MVLKFIHKYFFIGIIIMTSTMNLVAQKLPVLNPLPSLPGELGWAGMYGGVSKGILFCMGGANFPDKRPWEGGKKKWYDDIYMLRDGKRWEKIQDKLLSPSGYGVSISYNDNIIVIGGGDSLQYSAKVTGYKWNGKGMQQQIYPDLPVTLANMTGTLVGHLIIIAGGNTSPATGALNKCYALDLEDTQTGWIELPPWPGSERNFAVCTASNGKFYLFSGETVQTNALNEKLRHILQDAYSFTPNKENGKWTGVWKVLSSMPKGVSAGASPLPVLANGSFVFWGGVDAITALHTDPATHPGINKQVLLYSPEKDSWQYAGEEAQLPARVTLPVVFWKHQWVYINGEIRPGVRTNTVYGINN